MEQPNQSMHEHTVAYVEGTGHVLNRDGSPAICPFQAPFMIAAKVAGGPAQMQRFTCNTGCPMAGLYESGDDMLYVISCGGEALKIKVTGREKKEKNILIEG